jgi:ethanolamine ammonia-lyase small subunit
VLELRNFTMARVGLGRAGNSVSTRDLLAFQLDHARARDAVHGVFDPTALAAEIGSNAGSSAVIVESAARDRQEYLRRPDLGRRLSESSRRVLERMRGPFDTVFVVGDGLSPMAVQNQAAGLLRLVWPSGTVVIASQARVALSDEIGFILQASLAVMLIGERPGLSSFDSMGAYLTWSPRPGRTDAERNCISNIRPEGLSIRAAAELLLALMREARARRLSGVGLKAEGTRRLA